MAKHKHRASEQGVESQNNLDLEVLNVSSSVINSAWSSYWNIGTSFLWLIDCRGRQTSNNLWRRGTLHGRRCVVLFWTFLRSRAASAQDPYWDACMCIFVRPLARTWALSWSVLVPFRQFLLVFFKQIKRTLTDSVVSDLECQFVSLRLVFHRRICSSAALQDTSYMQTARMKISSIGSLRLRLLFLQNYFQDKLYSLYHKVNKLPRWRLFPSHTTSEHTVLQVWSR